MPNSFFRRIAPAIGLFFLAPFISEYLLGDFPLTKIGYLAILAPLYGGGALLIREVVRRSGRGWPTILMLAFAYAVFEEAFTTQTLFNPNYLKLNLHLLDSAFIPALGIGGWWTIFVLTLHTVWSISTSIALIEACVPDRANTPWLRWPGLTADTVLFVLAAIASTRFQMKNDSFRATSTQFIVSGIIVIVAAVVAFLLPARRAGVGPGIAPSPWLGGSARTGRRISFSDHSAEVGVGRGRNLLCLRYRSHPDRHVPVTPLRLGWTAPPRAGRRRGTRLRLARVSAESGGRYDGTGHSREQRDLRTRGDRLDCILGSVSGAPRR